MRSAGAFVLSAVLAVPAAAEVTVRVSPGVGGAASQVDLTARAAPLAEVLDRLGRQIGMKVVYEGATPRQLVTLSLQGRSPAETVLGLLEGQGLNFALVSDPTGTRVETLLVAGSAPTGSAAATTPTTGRSVPTPFRRTLSPPPGAGPDTMEDAEEFPDEEVFDEPAAGEVPVEAPEAAAAQADPTSTPQAPGPPSMPSPVFPVSPFAPQATPYTPQPFPPLPPGVPGGPTTPAPQPEEPTSPPPVR